MTRILVTSALPRDGKTVVAAGLAHALRRSGAPSAGNTVRLVRTPGGPSEATDAATFARLQGVRASGRPENLVQTPPDSDTDHAPTPDYLVVEVPDPADCDALRDSDTPSATKTLLITRHAEADDPALQRAVQAAKPSGLIVNQCPTGAQADAGLAEAQRLAALLGLPLLATLPQDRLLSAPLVEAMAKAIHGELGGDPHLWREAAEWLQVGPISAHSGIDYFGRYPDKSVITRNDKLDVALAALDSQPLCLILSGGAPNLPYIAQRAEQEEFALIITPLDTPQAVQRIGALYGDTPFVGARKLQRAVSLIAACPDLLPALAPSPA